MAGCFFVGRVTTRSLAEYGSRRTSNARPEWRLLCAPLEVSWAFLTAMPGALDHPSLRRMAEVPGVHAGVRAAVRERLNECKNLR
jgi:hypothetical protein